MIAVVWLHKLCEKKGVPVSFLQFFLYLFVGGSCSVLDVGGFFLLRAIDAPLLISSATSFTIATIVNYFLSYFLVFERGRFSMRHEFARVFAVSLAGLAFNTAFVYLFVTFAQLNDILSKIIAIPIVLVWNFLGRRLFVFHKTLPVSGRSSGA